MEQMVPSGATAVDLSDGLAQGAMQVVSFKLGHEEFALDILLVQEINRKIEITRVPKAPDFVEGVINLRGKIVPVLSLHKRLGLPPREWNGQSRIIIVVVATRMLGLLVDAVSEVLTIPAHMLQPPPPLGMGVEASYLKGVAKLEDRLIILLDLAKVLAATETAMA
jgi:purine-binding chemotaxis protein CheW